MNPKEKVNQLLKYRDELRKLARESNMISSDQRHMLGLKNIEHEANIGHLLNKSGS